MDTHITALQSGRTLLVWVLELLLPFTLLSRLTAVGEPLSWWSLLQVSWSWRPPLAGPCLRQGMTSGIVHAHMLVR
jgi:hypothetical protein